MLRGASNEGCMQRRGGRLVKRVIFLATAALLTMLILAPMGMAQGSASGSGVGCTFVTSASFSPGASGSAGQGFCMAAGGGGGGGSGASASALGGTGGPAILLPAAALLLGSGILTYAILRRR